MTLGIDASRAEKKEKTGTEWYSHHLLKAMSGLKSDHHFQLYVKDSLSFALPKNWHERIIFWPFYFFWTQGGLSLEMAVHAPDVLFVPSHAIPFIHPRRTITTIHDIGFHESPEYRSKKERGYLEWSTRYALTHCSRVIAISEFTKRELVRVYGANESKVTVVHLGVDGGYFSQKIGSMEIQTVRERYTLKNPYLLFVGRIDSRKNVERLVRAFEVLREQKIFNGDLVLAGPLGFDGEQVLNNITCSRYSRSIKYLGWVPEDDKRVLLHSTEVFVFPSLYEGFGLPVIEAQLCGAPVVCSNTTSLPEAAGMGALFCDPLNPEHIAKSVASVLSDTQQKGDLIAKGLLNAQRFSWERCARETLALLEG